MIAGRDEDQDFFTRAMSGVNPLHEKFRDKKTATKRVSTGHRPNRNQLPPAEPPEPEHIAVPDGPPVHGPVQFVRPGLQRNVIRKLKRGSYPVEDSLDLHGLYKSEAGQALGKFLNRAVQSGYRCVLVIHGKGHGSAGRQGVLKPYTVNWLKQHSAVLAFCSTQPRHGGTGSVYVLLKSNRQHLCE